MPARGLPGRLWLRGIAGGITSGVTYFGIERGSSTLAEIGIGCATARPSAKRHSSRPALAPIPYCTNRRRVIPAPATEPGLFALSCVCTVAAPFDSSRSSAAESTVKRGAGNPNAH